MSAQANFVVAKREAPGKSGRSIGLVTNAFPIKFEDFNVQHYDVSFSEDISKPLRRRLWLILYDTEAMFRETSAVFDGSKNAFTLHNKLPFDSREFTVSLPEIEGRKPKSYKLAIKFVASINLHALRRFVDSKAPASDAALTAITALNVMLRYESSTSLRFDTKGSSIYPTPQSQGAERARLKLSGGIEMWRGYFSSIRPAPGKLILNLNTTVQPYFLPGNLPALCAALLGLKDPYQLGNLSPKRVIPLNRFLKNLDIKVTERVDGRVHRFKIREFSEMPADVRTFDLDGRSITVKDYFTTKNISLQYPGLGCVRVTRNAWYPLELAEVLEGNRYTKKLNPEQISELLKFTMTTPNEKMRLITQGLKELNFNNSNMLKSWNFTIDERPLAITGRVLESPPLIAARKETIRARDGVFDLRGKHFVQPARIARWGVLVLESENNEPDSQRRFGKGFRRADAEKCITALVTACRAKGITIENDRPPIFFVGDYPFKDLWPEFMQIFRVLGNQAPELVVVFMPHKNAPQYKQVKRIGDVERGFATQCLVIDKAAKQQGQDAYYGNVALKINVKLSGVNVLPGFPVPGPQMDTIVFGADVSHPGPQSNNPSIAGIVGTSDLNMVKYFTEVQVQEARQEMIVELGPMVANILRKFYQKNRRKPTRVVFYRDGVSEGQFAQVMTFEVKALREACASLEATYRPKITYIICGKRHHFRFFPTTPAPPNARASQLNAPSGTVVDTGIVHPTDHDYYLLSHQGLLGTSRPTHYNVLLDENSWTSDQIQQFTLNLCYLYSRATRAVSIASPAYFAHHVCTRGRDHLPSAFDEETTATSTSDETNIVQQRLEQAKLQCSPIHAKISDSLYFL